MNPTDWLNQIWASDMPPNTKYLACFLRRFLHGDSRTCWPSKTRMMSETGLTKRTIRTHLANLTNYGWIDIDQSNGGRNNRYTIRQGTNSTGAIITPDRVDIAPLDGVHIAPLKSNIKSKRKNNKKMDAMDRLMDRSWSNI